MKKSIIALILTATLGTASAQMFTSQTFGGTLSSSSSSLSITNGVTSSTNTVRGITFGNGFAGSSAYSFTPNGTNGVTGFTHGGSYTGVNRFGNSFNFGTQSLTNAPASSLTNSVPVNAR